MAWLLLLLLWARAEPEDVRQVKMDALGPVVVNLDGSMRRISNWHEMTERERPGGI